MISKIEDLNIKIFADGANKNDILRLNSKEYIKGFTTNPSLMKKSGIKDYEKFSKEVLEVVNTKPFSLEVFADEFDEIEKQAKKISKWGDNVYVKIPITNSKGLKTTGLIKKLSSEGIKLNITAIFTEKQISETIDALNNESKAIVSIFAGRIADTGLDRESACVSKENFNIEIGQKISREDARNKVWLVEGYLLQQKTFDRA